MKQTKMFSVWKEVQGCIAHNAYVCVCVLLAELFKSLSFCHFTISTCLCKYVAMKYFRLLAPCMALTNISSKQCWRCSSASCQLTWWTKSQTGLDMHTGNLIISFWIFFFLNFSSIFHWARQWTMLILDQWATFSVYISLAHRWSLFAETACLLLAV